MYLLQVMYCYDVGPTGILPICCCRYKQFTEPMSAQPFVFQRMHYE